jgi:SAM-dependent methyltransferase
VISFNINSENSTDHWQYFDVAGKNVLDLGCGRWEVKEKNELSPFYFLNSGAKSVVGIDSNIEDVIYFNQFTQEEPRLIIKNDCISQASQVQQYIKEYNITALKSDIEGSEVVISRGFSKDDFDNINEVAIEYHSHDICREFMECIPKWGFTIKAQGKLHLDGYGVLFLTK